MDNIFIKIPQDNNNKRIDIALAKLSEFSRSMIQKLIYKQHILKENIVIFKPNHIVQTGEIYQIIPPTNIINEITPEPYNLDILFEDENLIIINKPAELIVHPGAGNPNNTLINKLAYHCQLSNINDPTRLGTVHRLDKGVSGCIIFAKNNKTHLFLNEQFAQRTIKKKYIAICQGVLHPTSQYLEHYITRNKIHRQKMQAHPSIGKLAQMNIKLLKTNGEISLIECNPITGRTHQIRVQLSSISMPILGDKLYNNKQNNGFPYQRIALHAYEIILKLPNNEIKIIQAPLPECFNII